MSRSGAYLPCFFSFLCFKFVSSCLSLNDEGKTLLKLNEKITNDPYDALSSWNCRNEETYDPCLWMGVECSAESLVVAVDLSDFCLDETLPPEIGNIANLKSLILCNNLLTGGIPQKLKDLKLKILDLDFNNFIDPSLDTVFKRQLIQSSPSPAPSPSPLPASRKPNGSPRHHSPSPGPARKRVKGSPRYHVSRRYRRVKDQEVLPDTTRHHLPKREIHQKISTNTTRHHLPKREINQKISTNTTRLLSKHKELSKLTIVLTTVGSVVCFLVIITTTYFCVVSKSTVRPWVVLSGPLQVPKFSRSEVEVGCEDFSNVIGTSPFGTVYKGTLTNGVEIAVTSPTVESLKNWSHSAESQFRSKIETLSKVNHKNFANLVGYCDEVAPFTRIMVFEYISNGSLFDHLHMPESEHLNWDTRVRIMIGIAYCLEHMHELDITVTNLASSNVFLTEDNAAKVTDMCFAGDASANLKGNVYGFGVVMFEMITGRVPSDTDEEWAFDFVGDDRSLMEMLDRSLEVPDGEKLRKIWELMRVCVRSEGELRPSMKHVAASLREITGISSDAAAPRGTRMWWAEMAIMSPQTG